MNHVTVRAFEMNDWQDVAELFLAPKCQWGTLQLPYQLRQKAPIPLIYLNYS